MTSGFVHRPIVMTRRGVVVAGHHAAAEAGARVLREGGNALDAAITAAATLAVAIPFMNGVGGDCFVLWFDRESGEVAALNGSGGAPLAATRAAYRDRRLEAVPHRGPLSISVPGAAHAWAESLRRYGTVPLAHALAPAIHLASDGLPVDRVLRDFLNGPVYADLAVRFPGLAEHFGPAGGRRLGEVLRQPALAETLRALARDGVESLYGGPVGEALATDAALQGALLAPADLAAHTTLVQTPLRAEYREHTVFASPPNTQGIAAALLLALLGEAERAASAPVDPGTFVALKRKAFAVRDRHLGDPAHVPDLQPMLDPEAVARLFAAGEASGAARPSGPAGGDTTTVVAMDGEGNAASLVQSLFEEFGSGIVSRRTGIVLQDRLHLASLVPGGPNSLGPGRRPFHTLCPVLLLKDGACRLAIATPGDHGQPQTVAQTVVNLLARHMDVQEAIEAPRIRHDSGDEVLYESRMPAGLVAPLRDLGYRPRDVGPWSRIMGGVNAIDCPDGVIRMAGADPRRASYAVAE